MATLIVGMPGMENRHREVLKRRRCSLVADLDVGHIIDQLIQDDVISIDDSEIITAETTRRKQARKLLSMLPSRGPDAYNSFKKGLNTSYKHLEEDLKICEKEILDEWIEEGKMHHQFLSFMFFYVMLSHGK